MKLTFLTFSEYKILTVNFKEKGKELLTLTSCLPLPYPAKVGVIIY